MIIKMDVLIKTLKLSKYEDVYGQRLLKIINNNNMLHLDYEINQLKDMVDEYANLIKDALLLNESNEKGHGTILLKGKNYLRDVEIKFSYFVLENDYYCYYLRFIPISQYSCQCDELIVLINKDKYICVGQENDLIYVMTDKFNFSEMNDETTEFFIDVYNDDIYELDKNTLLDKALNEYLSKIRRFKQ